MVLIGGALSALQSIDAAIAEVTAECQTILKTMPPGATPPNIPSYNPAAALTSAQDMKAFEQIRAPFAGTISARYVDVGSLVSSGSGRTVQKLFDLAQSNPVRVFVNVPQADVSSVRPGTPATVTVDEFSGQTFAGMVARDAGAFDLASRTLLLEIDVSNPNRRLYPGMYAHARLALQNPTRALLVPDNAIHIGSKGVRVFIVDASGKIEIRSVLGRDFGSKSEVLKGIDVTDRVVQNPTEDLHERNERECTVTKSDKCKYM